MSKKWFMEPEADGIWIGYDDVEVAFISNYEGHREDAAEMFEAIIHRAAPLPPPDALQARNEELEAFVRWVSDLDDRPNDALDFSDWEPGDIAKELHVAILKAREFREVCPICDRPSDSDVCQRCYDEQQAYLKSKEAQDAKS